MKETRRTLLRTTSALAAALTGGSSIASASSHPCPDYVEWVYEDVYYEGDQVYYDGADGSSHYECIYTQSQYHYPDENPGIWERLGDCPDADGGSSGPTASFTASSTTVQADETVDFNASSSEGSSLSYDWEFGDGATGSGETTSHSYDAADTYTVVLTVTDSDGTTDTDATDITVESGSSSNCEYPVWDPDTAYSGGDRVHWNGEDFEAEWWTKGEEPDDSKSVWTSLGACDGGGGGGSDGPTASFTASSTTVQAGETIDFDAGGSFGDITGYDWEFGDGATDSGEVVSHSYDAADSYTVTLTVTDSSGATDTDSTPITVESDSGGTTHEDYVIGYYTEWSRYDRNYYPEDVPLGKVTDLLYGFADVEADGSVVVDDSYAFEENMSSFQELKGDHPDTRFWLSIGGWTMSNHFSDAAHTQENRERFASTAIDLIRRYDFEGIDIDWEFPGGHGHADNVVREDDPENLALLLEEVRSQLDDAEAEDGTEYYLGMAVSANENAASDLLVGEYAPYLDHVAVMSYDFYGTYSNNTNFNAPMYNTSGNPHTDGDIFNVDNGMQWWKSAPIADEKLAMGLAFYGRSFSDVPDRNDGLYQDFGGAGPGTYEDGVNDYWDIEQNYETDANYEKFRHDEATVPWLYSAADGVMIGYDDPQSIEYKVNYAKNNGFGGVMFWEFNGDRDEVLLDTVLETL